MTWDRFVRFFHWSLAAGVTINYTLLEGGEDFHEWLGYGLAGLVIARIAWGFAGPHNARFASFVVGPQRILYSLQHFGDDYREHRGHTPLAGWMILLMLTLVLALAVTGWMQDLDAFWGEDWLEWLHGLFGDTLMACAAVHVAAVLWIQRRYRLPLLRSMLGRRHPGRAQAAGEAAEETAGDTAGEAAARREGGEAHVQRRHQARG